MIIYESISRVLTAASAVRHRLAARISVRKRVQSSRAEVFRISSAVRASTDGEDLVVLNIATSRLFRCNGAGTVVWRGLTANKTLEAIALELGSGSRISMTELASAIRGFVGELQALGLVVGD